MRLSKLSRAALYFSGFTVTCLTVTNLFIAISIYLQFAAKSTAVSSEDVLIPTLSQFLSHEKRPSPCHQGSGLSIQVVIRNCPPALVAQQVVLSQPLSSVVQLVLHVVVRDKSDRRRSHLTVEHHISVMDRNFSFSRYDAIEESDFAIPKELENS